MRIKKLTLSAILVSVGLVLGLIEAKIPVFTMIPGGKIGLSNVVSLISVYALNPAAAFVISVLKSFLVSVLSGAPTSFLYSGSGAVLSVLVMLISKKAFGSRVSAVGVSIFGALSFNIAQTAIAAIVVSNINILRYLPVLWFISAFSGLVTGLITNGILGGYKNV